MKRIFLLAIVLPGIIVCSCFTPWQGEEGTITINLPGNSAARSLARAAVPSAPILSQLSYDVTCTGPGGEKRATVSNGNNQVTFSLIPGLWTVSVYAYIPGNNVHVGTGSAQVTVTAGQNQGTHISLVFDNTDVGGITVTYNAIAYTAQKIEPNTYRVNIPAHDATVTSFSVSGTPMVDGADMVIANAGNISGGPWGGGDTEQVGITINAGTGYSASYTLAVDFEYIIGDTGPAGGRIFYKDTGNQFAWTYLECAPADANPSAVTWSDVSNPIGADVTGTSTAVGTGKTNTDLILARHVVLGDTCPAAQLCDAYTVINNGITYDDWFLPSQDELALIYTGLGSYLSSMGFNTSGAEYWTSTAYFSSGVWGAWAKNFNGGFNSGLYQNFYNLIRAVRSF